MSCVEFDETHFERASVRSLVSVRDAEAILSGIARAAGVTPGEVLAEDRHPGRVAARRELYVALRALGWSYPEIGRFVRRDHTTVIAAINGKVRKCPPAPGFGQLPPALAGSR